MALREEAERHKNPRIRKRLLALACVSDGMSVDDAVVQTRLERNVIYTWIHCFKKNGLSLSLLCHAVGREKNDGGSP